jgi:ketosteroid isomerase-like protein
VSEHPNATLARQMADKFNSGDLQAGAEMLADDIVWHEIGNPNAIHGLAALTEHMTGANAPDYTITAELHDVVANDDHTIGLATATATRDGKSFTYRVAEIYHIKDGKVTERWAFSDDTDAITKFFA